MQQNLIVIRDCKTFFKNFDRSKHVEENLKSKIAFTIKGNKSLAGDKIKNQIEQILLKYKYGKNIYEHGKQPNQ